MKSRKCGKTFSLDSTDEEEYSSLDEEDDKEIVVEPPITPIDSLLDDIVATNLDDFDSAEDEERGEVKNTPLNDIESETTLVEDVIFSSDEDEKKEEAPPKNKSIQDIYNFIRGLSPYPAAWTELVSDEDNLYYAKILDVSMEKLIHKHKIYNIIYFFIHVLSTRCITYYILIIHLFNKSRFC